MVRGEVLVSGRCYSSGSLKIIIGVSEHVERFMAFVFFYVRVLAPSLFGIEHSSSVLFNSLLSFALFASSVNCEFQRASVIKGSLWFVIVVIIIWDRSRFVLLTLNMLHASWRLRVCFLWVLLFWIRPKVIFGLSIARPF